MAILPGLEQLFLRALCVILFLLHWSEKLATLFSGKIISVGIAEFKTASPPDALHTTLGSCVGIVLYHPRKRIGGLAHVLLAKPPAGRIAHRGKYARPAIRALAQGLTHDGTAVAEFHARLFGGATMFGAKEGFIHKIGKENIEESRRVLEELQIPIIAEDTGGNEGRSITFFLDDGRILLRKNGKEKYIYKV